MKKLPLFLLLTSLLMVLSGCGPESSRVSSRLSENIPKYIDCLGQTKKEVFQTLQIDRDPEPEGEGLNLGPFLPETIESKEFGLVLEFYSWEEKGRLRGFYYTTNLPDYADEEMCIRDSLHTYVKISYPLLFKKIGRHWQNNSQ